MEQSGICDSALDVLDQELGYSISRRWHEDKGRCFANRKNLDIQCQNRRRLPSAGEPSIPSLLDALAALDTRTSLEKCAKTLEKLVDAAVCYCHEFKFKAVTRRWRRERFQSLRSPVSEGPSSPSPRPRPATTNNSSVELEHVAYSRYNLRSSTTTTTTITSSSANPPRPDFIRHNHSETLEIALNKPLSSYVDHRKGYIYVYTTPITSLLKIGYTTRAPAERLSDWSTQCRRPAEPVYISSRPIPHAHRVEELVHAELRLERWKEVSCRGCGRGHKEWFGCSKQKIEEVVKKWESWIEGERYVEGGDGVWRLREDGDEDGSASEEEDASSARSDEEVLERIEKLVADMGADFERTVAMLAARTGLMGERQSDSVGENEGQAATARKTVSISA